MKKKLLKLLAIFCISLICFMSCDGITGGKVGTGSEGGLLKPNEPAFPLDEEIVLTVWESANGLDEFINKAGEAFSAKYPNVKIKFEAVESSEAADKIALDGPAGVGADLFAGQQDQVGKLVTGNHIKSVSFTNKIEKSLLNSCRQTSTYEGKTWGYQSLHGVRGAGNSAFLLGAGL